MGEDRLHEALLTKGVPADHAEAVIEYVYRSDNINRYGFRRTVQAFERSGLKVVEIGRAMEDVPSDRLAILRRQDPEEDFTVRGVRVAAFDGEGSRIRNWSQARAAAFETAPDSPEWTLLYAEQQTQHGRLDEAEMLVRKAIDRDPGLVKCHELLADILRRKGEIRSARATLENASAQWPDDVALAQRLGELTTANATAKRFTSWRRLFSRTRTNGD